eukprot:TRINITY_DN28182_c0_g1_i1.p1 TRINITY_DN28182_c0_g1~~TRINITY_DN28182_c0_g1_i1.p1  ORF type:complete len:2018 (+),score=352.66 TRINITY_DN28182_c0_g1_i1:636-6056(+)
MINIHARVLEGYLVWLEAQRHLPQRKEQVKCLLYSQSRPSWVLFAEAALLRIMESLAEQVLHAPELISFLYHRVRWPEESEAATFNERLPEQFIIHYDKLHAGIEVFRRNSNPYAGGVNFDDMNDCGESWADSALDSQTMEKTFLESPSWRVLFDLLDNFGPVITIKLWIFFLAFFLHIGSSSDQSADFLNPNSSRSDAVQIMALLDGALLLLSELGLLWHGASQRRLFRSPGRFRSRLHKSHRQWVRRRLMSLIIGVVGLSGMLVCGVGLHLCAIQDFTGQPAECTDTIALLACAAYGAVRILGLIIITRRRGIPFLRGRPKEREEASPPEPSIPEQAPDDSFITVISDDIPTAVEKESKDWTPHIVWSFVLALCFGFETWLVAPLVSGFSMNDFCSDSCAGRLFAWSFSVPVVGELHVIPSECMACYSAVVAIYVLVAMTAFLDVHFIFYTVIGIGGYAMGEHRGLRNVLSSALRHLDLDASTRRQEIHENELYTSLSDGRAMEAIFGSAWRLVWSCTVESLYDDCLITDGIANNMVNAARTFRWRDRDTSEMQFAGPTQRFMKLRFKASQLRGGSWQQAGQSCCVSALQVKHGPCSSPEEYKVSKSVIHTVKVSTPDEHAELMKVLDDRLVVTEALASLGIDRGWQLLSHSGAALAGLSATASSGSSTPTRSSITSALSQTPSTSKRLSQRRLSSSRSVAEDLVKLRAASNFPAELKFTDPSAFREVVVDFKRPRRIHAVSFTTTSEDRQFDPLCWEIDASPDGHSWQRVQTQLQEFDTPSERGKPVDTFFASEPWRCANATGSSLVDLRQVPPIVSERLCFFASSLRALLKQGTKPEFRVRPGRDTLLDSELGGLPTLTQVVPVYNEQIILSEDFLLASDGRNTNLGFLISQAEEQWSIFAKKHGMEPRELFNAFTLGVLRESARRAEVSRNVERSCEIQGLIREIRLWASKRSQTVARTVAGAIQYHRALEMLPCVQGASKPSKALEGQVQLLIAHQTYGNKRFDEAVDQDMRLLLWLHRDYPVLLVCDYDASLARSWLKDMVARFMAREHRFTGSLRYASLLLRFNEAYSPRDSDFGIVKIVEILPRVYPLVLGELEPHPPAAKTQGKAGNQLGALRFAPGHYLQMMDANMGAFFGEACKVPFVLRHFQPPGSDRRTVKARIIGFRENIFTGCQGAVGAAMADAEWTFGTVCQRFLAGLGARMHYGHPDFFDAFWASNRGSVSKASPILNLSEDIFAGFNVLMRGEISTHVDCLEWEKGREVSFNKASQFFTKVASGNVGVMRSRDLKVLTEHLNIADSFSFYFASVGFYLYNLVTDLSMKVYVVIFVLLTLSTKSLDDVGKLGSLLAAEWVVSFGTLAMFPRLMELILEYGVMEGVTRFLPSIPGAVTMFTFMNKSIAAAISSTMQTGLATYISTGRPTANNHYSWRECYFLYRQSHYYPALRILIMYAAYRLLAKSFTLAALPMMVLLATACIWLIGPILFCPQPTLWSIRDDLSEFWCFVIGASGVGHDQGSQNVANLEDKLAANIENERANLYDVWLCDKLQQKRAPVLSRTVELLAHIFLLGFMLSVVFGTMVDQMRTVLLLVSVNYFLLALWRVFDRPTILMMISAMFWLFSLPLILNSGAHGGEYGTLLVSFILVFQALNVMEKALLLGAWALIRPDPDCALLPEGTAEERAHKQTARRRVDKYDAVVEYLYLCFMSYQWHLYVAILLVVVNLAAQLAIVILEMLGGLHSWWLLGGKLKGSFCRIRREAYKPEGSDHAAPSERIRELTGDLSQEPDTLRERSRLGQVDVGELT